MLRYDEPIVSRMVEHSKIRSVSSQDRRPSYPSLERFHDRHTLVILADNLIEASHSFRRSEPATHAALVRADSCAGPSTSPIRMTDFGG